VSRAEGRPARRYFTLTASGAAALRAALEKYKALRPLPGFSPEQA
jgi:DNA-binding PadR family transcriptional regulator